METCKYCGEREAIENSHVIPSFIYKWLKDTSTTGYMRATNEPNKRKQDGLKSPLLCTECESRFSEIENIFKKEFFNKIANYRNAYPEAIKISASVKKCISIIAWRVLADAYFFPKEHEYTEEEFNKFPDFLDGIKNSIESNATEEYRIHLIPCVTEVIARLGLPEVDHFYYERSIGAEPRIWDNWERFIIFIKIPFAIIIFEVVPGKNDCWQGTRIDNKEIASLSEVTSVPEYIADQINRYFNGFLKSVDKMSPEQKKVIIEGTKKSDPNCGSFKTMRKTWR